MNVITHEINQFVPTIRAQKMLFYHLSVVNVTNYVPKKCMTAVFIIIIGSRHFGRNLGVDKRRAVFVSVAHCTLIAHMTSALSV
jgi:hypothetical protein